MQFSPRFTGPHSLLELSKRKFHEQICEADLSWCKYQWLNWNVYWMSKKRNSCGGTSLGQATPITAPRQDCRPTFPEQNDNFVNFFSIQHHRSSSVDLCRTIKLPHHAFLISNQQKLRVISKNLWNNFSLPPDIKSPLISALASLTLNVFPDRPRKTAWDRAPPGRPDCTVSHRQTNGTKVI